MAIYKEETDANLTKEIEVIITRNYYKTGSVKITVPFDFDESNVDIQQLVEDADLTQELEDDLQDSSLNNSDDSDEYEIN